MDQQWCFSLQSYEEQKGVYKWRVRNGIAKRDLVLHNHRHGIACNEKCDVLTTTNPEGMTADAVPSSSD